jgi:hypothetical protein
VENFGEARAGSEGEDLSAAIQKALGSWSSAEQANVRHVDREHSRGVSLPQVG